MTYKLRKISKTMTYKLINLYNEFYNILKVILCLTKVFYNILYYSATWPITNLKDISFIFSCIIYNSSIFIVMYILLRIIFTFAFFLVGVYDIDLGIYVYTRPNPNPMSFDQILNATSRANSPIHPGGSPPPGPPGLPPLIPPQGSGSMEQSSTSNNDSTLNNDSTANSSTSNMPEFPLSEYYSREDTITMAKEAFLRRKALSNVKSGSIKISSLQDIKLRESIYHHYEYSGNSAVLTTSQHIAMCHGDSRSITLLAAIRSLEPVD